MGASGVIAYTLDESDVDDSPYKVIEDPPVIIDVSRTMTIKAQGSAYEHNDSGTVTARYTISNPQSFPPVFELPNGYGFEKSGGVYVAFDADLLIYTTDGSDPKFSPTAIEVSSLPPGVSAYIQFSIAKKHRIALISFDRTSTIKAFTRSSGVADSEIVEAFYFVKE